MIMTEKERALDALKYIDSGCGREEWIRIGMSMKAAGLDFADFDNWSVLAANYKDERDTRRVWDSFSANGGISAGSLYAIAKENGWRIRKSTDYTRPALSAKATNANAIDVWERCIQVEKHQYIDRKQGNTDGVRVYPAGASPLVIRGQNVAGYLVVPAWDDKDLQTLQFIPPCKGDKLNLPGASFNDGFFTVNDIATSQKVYICEGIGQAWAVTKADTGSAAACCFGAMRMSRVAAVLREKFPTVSMIIVPDRGKEDLAAKIAANVVCKFVSIPPEKPSNHDVSDYLVECGTIALTALLKRAVAPPMRYELLSDADLCKLPPQQWRIKRVLPKTGLAAIYGPSGSGKSFLVLDAIQSLAEGLGWFGYKTRPCNVLYCALEGEGGIAGRVSAYRIRHGSSSSNIRYLVQQFSLLDEADIHDLAQAIKANGQSAEVVVLDTLNRAAPGADENDSKSMGQIIAAAKQLQILTGGLVLLVHHTGKDASKGLRGHSSLHAALDAAIEVRRYGDRREWLIAKSKDGMDGEEHQFNLDVVALGLDEDGEQIKSCVVVPDYSDEETMQQAKRPTLRSNQKIAKEALVEALHDRDPFFVPEGRPRYVPAGSACIKYEEAVTIVAERIPANLKHKIPRAKTAITGLVGYGYLIMKNEWLWFK